MAALTASAGGLTGSLPGIVALTPTLVVAGVTYGWLWTASAWPGVWVRDLVLDGRVARRATGQELLVGQGIPEGVMGFVVYQALVGGAFGLGVLLLQNQVSTLLLNARTKRASAHGGRVDA
ncbi:MAG: hypothetical protein GEU68_14015 [Actinobacteria bacterium]|nr:hypothetical protein [Actinomycetota bacterium]